MITANQVTLFRIALVPVFVALMVGYVRTGTEWLRWLGVLAFAVAAISDAVDGYLARRYDQQSELGAWLDPLADKLLLVSALLLLVWDGGARLPDVPRWLVGAVLCRDVLLALGMVVIYRIRGARGAQVRPRFIGKLATVLLIAVLCWAFLKWDETWLWRGALAAAVCTTVSGLLYLGDWVRLMNRSAAGDGHSH